ncbi:MAG: hypothetical protein ACK42Z_09655, partial [Candidatus Kapaibacteriota bacterium]
EISTFALERAINILKEYNKYITEYQVEKVLCVGTSAIREAKNSSFVIRKIEEEVGISVMPIDGEFEAFLSFIGTVQDDSYSIVIDIGGGSTELIAGENGKISFRKSFSFGVVKLTEIYAKKHPPDEKAINEIEDFLNQNFHKINRDIVKGKIYAVAGTPTTIAAVVQNLKAYDSTKVDNYVLTLDKIKQAKDLFLSMSIEEIVSRLYVPPLRADVITIGTIILEIFCEYFKIDSVIVSDKGLRYGIAKYFTSK